MTLASVTTTTTGPITRIDTNGFRATTDTITAAANTPIHARLGGGAFTYARENAIAAREPSTRPTVMNGPS